MIRFLLIVLVFSLGGFSANAFASSLQGRLIPIVPGDIVRVTGTPMECSADRLPELGVTCYRAGATRTGTVVFFSKSRVLVVTNGRVAYTAKR